MSAAVGTVAPAFELRDQSKSFVSSESLRGRKALVVFIPFPFTGTCEGEMCVIRDHLHRLEELNAGVVVITCDTVPANAKWSSDNDFNFPVLSDFWPHGATTKAYGAFNETTGSANRYSFVLDAEGTIREIINTDSLGTAREFDRYVEALGAIA